MKRIIPGLLLCTAIAAVSLALKPLLPIGAVTTAILLGIIYGNTVKSGPATAPGISFCEKHLLAVAIALLGTELNFTVLARLGYYSAFLVIGAMAVTLAVAVPVAKLTGLPKRFGLLLGIGSAVCGSSAIAAAAPVIGADEEETGLSVAIVNFLGTVGILILPLISTIVLKFSEVNAGIMVGNTLQAVGHVVAAGFSISETAGQTATVVKMARILMLSPLLILLVITAGRHNAATGARSAMKLRIPPFIIGFLAMSLTATFHLLPDTYISMLGQLGKYLLTAAMAGIGLKITFSSIIRDGSRALAAGSILFVIQIIFSALVIYLFMV